ncbi:hypothetical protein EC957_001869 [Mortierella hygrophila]|uniref:Protein kinase domain-containing protein n=1 Tax=Mortierella hygrophila TaxID=979708 RepID=A0A9P6F5R8_9FUNG|nr:hypothetical protein EC957_001869 [Mortierella hygrophila]
MPELPLRKRSQETCTSTFIADPLPKIRNETHFLGRLQGHHNVAKMYGIVEDERGSSGLSCNHEAGIRHCDLKSKHALVAKGMQFKISDFGLAEESPTWMYDHANEHYPGGGT